MKKAKIIFMLLMLGMGHFANATDDNIVLTCTADHVGDDFDRKLHKPSHVLVAGIGELVCHSEQEEGFRILGYGLIGPGLMKTGDYVLQISFPRGTKIAGEYAFGGVACAMGPGVGVYIARKHENEEFCIMKAQMIGAGISVGAGRFTISDLKETR